MLAIVCAFGGPLVNKLGVKWSLVIGAATFPIRGASYYTNSKYGNQWVSSDNCDLPKLSVWSLMMVTLVPYSCQLSQWRRYWFLVRCGSWFHPLPRAIRGERQVLGSLDCIPQPRAACWWRNQVSLEKRNRSPAIRVPLLTVYFSQAWQRITSRVWKEVSPLILTSLLSSSSVWRKDEFPTISTLIESIANTYICRLPFAFLISPLERVVRSDGTRIVVSESLGTKQELKQIRITATSKLILLSCIWAFWSFFYR